MRPRLEEVMQCIIAGMDGEQIAKALFLSPKTVRHYRVEILQVLGAHNMAHAVALYLSRQEAMAS